MRAFLSTIGSRGDVQPLLALAVALRDRGHGVTLCAAPDFGAWIAAHGVAFVPIGPPLRAVAITAPTRTAITAADAARLAAGTVHAQFAVLREAVRGHDVLVGAGVLQHAAPSIAEALGIPSAFVAYCPDVVPSDALPPADMRVFHPFDRPPAENRALWAAEGARWDGLFGAALDEERAALGLAPVEHVLPYVVGPAPWLAADPTLGPPAAGSPPLVQTGAWRLADPAPLPRAVEAFLDAGEAPVYLGFGSMRDPPEVGARLLAAARSVGRRAIVSRGWAGLAPGEAATDCLVVDDLPHDALFARVAAVVHHGGAGTTTTAAAAGCPQVVVPHNYDQGYWAHRVATLGVGVALPPLATQGPEALAEGLAAALAPEVGAAARALAPRIVRDGADRAVDLLAARLG